MRTTAAALALLLLQGVSLADDLKAPAAVAKHPDISVLVAQLGDRDYATREAAMKRLEEIGPPALTPLEAATRSDIPEVAERATQLLTRISRRLDAERVLAPTCVELPADELTRRLRVSPVLLRRLPPRRSRQSNNREWAGRPAIRNSI